MCSAKSYVKRIPSTAHSQGWKVWRIPDYCKAYSRMLTTNIVTIKQFKDKWNLDSKILDLLHKLQAKESVMRYSWNKHNNFHHTYEHSIEATVLIDNFFCTTLMKKRKPYRFWIHAINIRRKDNLHWTKVYSSDQFTSEHNIRCRFFFRSVETGAAPKDKWLWWHVVARANPQTNWIKLLNDRTEGLN